MLLILFLLFSLTKALVYWQKPYLLNKRGLLVNALTLAFALLIARGLGPVLAVPLELFLPMPGHALDTSYAFYPAELIPDLDTAYFRLAAFCLLLVLALFLLRRLLKPLLLFFQPETEEKLSRYQAGWAGFYALVDTYLLFFFTLQLLTFIGQDKLQEYLASDFWVSGLLFQSPVLSQWTFSFIFEGLAYGL
ncbi:hypothetical protein F6I03_02345 [Aerococcus sanguinicola]|uniref:CvpA family protein n=1 Tax=Aerococcus sanguinicola TaxID=119206 RepID=A0A5N1GMQ1_9LACT|nr:hypothetical protein [Aerococcus sanguinicola]KAA9302072.1 hypothetical protein F6I03_02345 [Aerococcus sanguinicola]